MKQSEILKENNEVPDLMAQWMPNDENVEIRLLYRASRDG